MDIIHAIDDTPMNTLEDFSVGGQKHAETGGSYEFHVERYAGEEAVKSTWNEHTFAKSAHTEQTLIELMLLLLNGRNGKRKPPKPDDARRRRQGKRWRP